MNLPRQFVLVAFTHPNSRARAASDVEVGAPMTGYSYKRAFVDAENARNRIVMFVHAG